MPEFSITQAALTGFRFAREHPAAIVAWAILSFIATFLNGWLMISMAGESLAQLRALQDDPTAADPTMVFGAMGSVYSAMFVGLIPALVISALITTAAVRGVLRPESGGLGFLRLGPDEFRMIVVLIVVGVILVVVTMVGAFIASIGGVIGAVASGAAPQPGQLSGAMLAIFAPVMIVTGILALYIYGRFSLAPSLTVDRKAINIFSSMTLTKGRGGKIFQTLLIAAGLYLVVIMLGIAIFSGIAAAITGDIAQVQTFLMAPDMSSTAALFTPLRLIYLVLMSVISALGAAIMLTPPATIYQSLTAEGVDEVV